MNNKEKRKIFDYLFLAKAPSREMFTLQTVVYCQARPRPIE